MCESKLTQKEFGELIGAAKSTVERWEAGSKPVTGPIALLLEYMKEYPEYVEELKIPAREYPQRMWYMYRDRVCTLIDVNELERKVRIKNYTNYLMFRAFGRIEKLRKPREEWRRMSFGLNWRSDYDRSA